MGMKKQNTSIIQNNETKKNFSIKLLKKKLIPDLVTFMMDYIIDIELVKYIPFYQLFDIGYSLFKKYLIKVKEEKELIYLIYHKSKKFTSNSFNIWIHINILLINAMYI